MTALLHANELVDLVMNLVAQSGVSHVLWLSTGEDDMALFNCSPSRQDLS